ncbi:hypothetical protein GCM10027162_12110 [Streptomyces incanus]
MEDRTVPDRRVDAWYPERQQPRPPRQARGGDRGDHRPPSSLTYPSRTRRRRPRGHPTALPPDQRIGRNTAMIKGYDVSVFQDANFLTAGISFVFIKGIEGRSYVNP